MTKKFVQYLAGISIAFVLMFGVRATAVAQNSNLGDFGITDLGQGNFKFLPVHMSNITVTKYVWSFGDGDSATNLTRMPQTHQYSTIGTYAVTLTVYYMMNGQQQQSSITHQIFVDFYPNGIKQANALASVISIYPNPAQSILHIRAKTPGVSLKSVSVYNMMGARVYQGNLGNAAEAQISLSSLASGIYQIRINTSKGTLVSKFQAL